MNVCILGACLCLCASHTDASGVVESSWRVVGHEAAGQADQAEVEVVVTRSKPSSTDRTMLPVRVIVMGSDGKHYDGGGHGLYDDGRFFADGTFRVALPPGDTRIDVRSGPNHVPLAFSVPAEAGKCAKVAAELCEWLNPATLGWYCGDNHVHAQHDARADVKTGLGYLARQARASGLNFVTEAGSNVSYEDLDRHDTDSFLLRYAGELRPAAFVGHFNTPGISRPIPPERYEQLIRRPLPGQAIFEEVHRLGGVTIHTHPLSPPQLRHWMGATEILSDAVLGRCADLIDLDSTASQQLWFAVLNLGNRVAASGSTDSALGRRRTSSPGDRRVYCQADRLDYGELVAAMREGRTFCTNGGPLFATLQVAGKDSGSVLDATTARTEEATIDVHSLHPLRSVTLYCRGNVVKKFDVDGLSGHQAFAAPVPIGSSPHGWFVARAEDVEGYWAVTSPVYADSEASPRPPATLALLEISNHERFIHLRRDYFAHLIVTVSPEQDLQYVELMRDDTVVRRFAAAEGSQLHESRIPVTQMPGTYGPGWAWLDENERAIHFQADWPVNETGWYRVRAVTDRGHFESDQILFDANNPASQAISTANLHSQNTALTLHGYGEELPLNEIDVATPDDRWWYPRNTYWCLETEWDGTQSRFGSNRSDQAARLFRSSDR